MKETLRFIKFTFFSISAGLIEIGTFALMNENLHAPLAELPLRFGSLDALEFHPLNRKFSFQSFGNISAAMLKVVLDYAVFTPLATLLEHWLTMSLGLNEYIITAIKMILSFTTEFLYQRYYIFANTVDKSERILSEYDHLQLSGHSKQTETA